MSVTRVLIANRGEIAVRIVRACHELGIEAVAVYSDADAVAPHVRQADAAVRLGPEAASESYLNIDRVLAAAAEAGCDAVHPGYGFLSENATFAQRCVEAGLTFVGPSADAMRALGDNARAKRVAADANVPTVPEWAPEEVPADAYPVLVKAAAGGGGRGMRRVDRAEDLPGALESARREAAAGFGDDTLIVEQLVTGARHVEVQLLADSHGTRLYVGDRDCSLQRRHQKVVEEAPAPGLSYDLHRSIGEAAVRLAEHAGYENAGTAEFLVDREGRFYFLELNARLQVEHPVTEEAFGIDLAQWQLRIARGEALAMTQEELQPRAFAIEARVYAEDPVTFLPTGGEIVRLQLPERAGVRVDHALEEGRRVSLAYDPLLAKVIATGSTREEARRRLITALADLSILGAVTNTALLIHALRLPQFTIAEHDTSTLEANLLDESALEPSAELELAARRIATSGTSSDDPFRRLVSWRLPEHASDELQVADPDIDARFTHLRAVERGDELWFTHAGVTYCVPRNPIARAAAAAGTGTQDDHASLIAPMPGTVIKVLEAGSAVSVGDPIVVLEAMKMENAIAAPFDGRVDAISCSVGDLVSKGSVLAEVAR